MSRKKTEVTVTEPNGIHEDGMAPNEVVIEWKSKPRAGREALDPAARRILEFQEMVIRLAQRLPDDGFMETRRHLSAALFSLGSEMAGLVGVQVKALSEPPPGRREPGVSPRTVVSLTDGRVAVLEWDAHRMTWLRYAFVVDYPDPDELWRIDVRRDANVIQEILSLAMEPVEDPR